MASSVLASSLSSITQLAGNPPKYPRNPAESKREPLILYIARVPGSKDIILTTLKPRLKNVTSEDVASSLYYLHLDVPGDTELGAQNSVLEEDEYATPMPLINDSVIPRKPLLPKRRTLESETSPFLPMQPGSDLINEASVLSSKSENYRLSNQQRPLVDRKPLPQTASISRAINHQRPVGPRPNPSQSGYHRDSTLSQNEPSLISDSTFPDSRSQLDQLPPYESDPIATAISEEPQEIDRFSITLIRRDPTSGAQWNIGKIRCQQSQETHTFAPRDRPKKERLSQAYFVHLDTLGYGQFRGSRVNSGISQHSTGNYGSKSFQSNTGFDRIIQMEGSTFRERTFKPHQRSSSDQSGSYSSNIGSSGENNSTSPPFVSGGSSSSTTERTKGRGYVFISPWNGRCEFFTGLSGRSLKCKHRLPNPPSTNGPVTYSSEAVHISELRFNFPSAAVFDRSRSSSPNKSQSQFSGSSAKSSKLEHVRNKLSGSKNPEMKPPPNSYAAMYPNDDDDMGVYERLDLSLGREEAGGGKRGNRAKLGKLIVFDEGLKMLDLVVASNMGVWWGIWEK